MSDLTYAFAIGPAELARQSKWLLQSIRANTSAETADIVTYVVDSERDAIPNETLDYIDRNSTLVEGEMPNPEYPLSAAHAALIEATTRSQHPYTLLLDTDTVLIDDISVHKRYDSDLFAVPEPVDSGYWASPESLQDWQSLVDRHDINLDSDERARMSNHRPFPYYNSGVILVDSDSDFPKEYRDLSKRLYDGLQQDQYYADMVALSLLANEYETEILPDSFNWLQKAYLRSPPDDVKIIHYPETMSLYRSLQNPMVSDRFQETELATYFQNMSKREFYPSLIASQIKAYELARPDSLMANIIGGLIKMQFKLRAVSEDNA